MVKFKVGGVVLFSVILWICVQKFNSTNPNANRNFYWHPDSTMSISDFQKEEDIFREGYDAAIHSYIHLSYFGKNGLGQDSSKAFTIMDRHRSWFDESKSINQELLLRHEEYHANLTHVGTNWLNQIIKLKKLDYNDASVLRDSISDIISQLQIEYDLFTDHSLNQDYQDYWEFKIDSMLNNYTEKRYSDIFSGASAFFPTKPSYFVKQDTFLLYKGFVLDRYNMLFRFMTQYDSYFDTISLQNRYEKQLKSNFIEVSSKVNKWNGLYTLETTCWDTATNRHFHDRIIVDGQNSYHLSFFHPHKTEGEKTSAYNAAGKAFFNSFELKDRKDFWIKYYSQKGSSTLNDVTYHKNSECYDCSTISSLSYSDNSLIYHKPFIHDNTILIPFKIIRHKFEEINEIVIKMDKVVLTQQPDSIYQLLDLDLSKFPPFPKEIQFGYTLKEDSIHSSYHFYSTVLKDLDF